jgi:hypothetical protein
MAYLFKPSLEKDIEEILRWELKKTNFLISLLRCPVDEGEEFVTLLELVEGVREVGDINERVRAIFERELNARQPEDPPKPPAPEWEGFLDDHPELDEAQAA